VNNLKLANILFSVEIQRNLKRKFSIEVLRGKRLKVSAPDFAKIEEIKARIIKKTNWILFQDSSFNELPLLLPKRLYFTGESYYLLGEQFSLVVGEGDDCVEVKNRKIYLNVSNEDKCSDVFNDWLLSFADEFLEQKFMDCLKKFQVRLGVDVQPRFSVRKMKKRWGSCSPNNLITLNLELISSKERCIEYVIYHELVHTLFLDHSREFYQTLSKLCPDFQSLKRELDQETQLIAEP